MACEEPVHNQLSESPLVQGSIKWPPKIPKKFAPPQTLTQPEPRTSEPSDNWADTEEPIQILNTMPSWVYELHRTMRCGHSIHRSLSTWKTKMMTLTPSYHFWMHSGVTHFPGFRVQLCLLVIAMFFICCLYCSCILKQLPVYECVCVCV